MSLHGAWTDHQLLSDGPITQPLSDQAQHLQFPCSQFIRSAGCCGRSEQWGRCHRRWYRRSQGLLEREGLFKRQGAPLSAFHLQDALFQSCPYAGERALIEGAIDWREAYIGGVAERLRGSQQSCSALGMPERRRSSRQPLQSQSDPLSFSQVPAERQTVHAMDSRWLI